MYKSIFFALVLLICSCAYLNNRESKNITQSRLPRPVKCVVATTSNYIERDFVGLSTPMMAVNLAFKLSGQILDLPVVKGQVVIDGELLAKIDPMDVELQLSADRSTYEQARSHYERAVRLSKHEAISQQEVESSHSAFTRAKSQYENSEDLLAQTALRSPFKAIVERVFVDTYQRISAGESILRVVSPTTTSVEFTLPESSLPAIKDSLTTFSVRFDQLPNISFQADVTEYAQTSSDASGFPVTLRIQNPDNHIVSSGMSCTITMKSTQEDHHLIKIPLSAIYSPTAGGTYVWIVDKDDRVELRRVEVERPTGRESVIVKGGVTSGEKVVSAGVYQLQNNQRVTILK